MNKFLDIAPEVKEALEAGNITIADLDRFNIEYYKHIL